MILLSKSYWLITHAATNISDMSLSRQVQSLIDRAYLSEKIYAPVSLKQRGFSNENPLNITMSWSLPIKAAMIRDLRTGKVADMRDADDKMLREVSGVFVRYNYRGQIDMVDMASDGLYRIRRYVKELLNHTAPIVSDRYSSQGSITKVVGPAYRRSSGRVHSDDYVTVPEGEIQRLTFRELLFGFWIFSPVAGTTTPAGYLDADHLAATLEDALRYYLQPLSNAVSESNCKNVEGGLLKIKHINAYWDRVQ